MFENEVKSGLFAASQELAFRRSEPEYKAQKYRSMFMRDRDRVLYSKSFRRLSGKTQIYLFGSNDHQRNRLTHTLEVAQIAATISNALGLDKDLTEAIALGHDLGHAPFGHAGEQELHYLMTPKSIADFLQINLSDDIKNKDLYGFKHNLQSVRMAITIENIYGTNGLDLTNYTLWGIQRHSSEKYTRAKVATDFLNPTIYNSYKNYYCLKDCDQEAWSFEAFVVAEADEIAQLHHDLEDAIRGGAMSRTEVTKTVENNISQLMSSEDMQLLKKMKSKLIDDDTYIVYLSKVVVNSLVNCIIDVSMENLKYIAQKYSLNKKNILDFFKEIKSNDQDITNAISYASLEKPTDLFKKQRKYSQTIATKVHNSFTVQRMNTKGQYVIRKLFEAYFSNPQQLPNHYIIQYLISMEQYSTKELAMRTFAKKGEGVVRTKFVEFQRREIAQSVEAKIELMRVICDHIASMTDKYALEEFKRLYN